MNIGNYSFKKYGSLYKNIYEKSKKNIKIS
jgi:hypothetical protein